MAKQSPQIFRTVLPSGITVVTEPNPRHSVLSLGFWVKQGSRYERDKEFGAAHFVEHMLFKGTPTRTPLKIAQEIESVGGEINAFTDRESVCYHTIILGEDIGIALNLFEDILLNSTFPAKEIERERQVILEEIKMYEDSPDDFVIDLLYDTIFPNHPLGRSILGDKKSIRNMPRQKLWNLYKRTHIPELLVVTAAGAIDHNFLVQEVEKRFREKKKAERAKITKPSASGTDRSVSRPVEQVHMAIGFEAIPFRNDLRDALRLLNIYLGYGMGSQLFQKVREEQGLAYSVSSSLNLFSDTGILLLYAGTSRKQEKKCRQLMDNIVDKISGEGIPKKMLEPTKKQLAGLLMIASEDPEDRMHSLGHYEILYGKPLPLREEIDRVNAVTGHDVQTVAEKVFSSAKASVSLGPKRATKRANKRIVDS